MKTNGSFWRHILDSIRIGSDSDPRSLLMPRCSSGVSRPLSRVIASFTSSNGNERSRNAENIRIRFFLIQTSIFASETVYPSSTA